MQDIPDNLRVGSEDPPLVTVVTPSLNCAPFLEDTIGSVLSQDYPHIEYIVMDGGSTDGTRAILSRYSGRLKFHVREDRGASDAIQAGFDLSHGNIFTFLCADDTLLPGAVSCAVRHLKENPEAIAVYGKGWWVDERGERIAPYPTLPFDREQLMQECFICQPASFVRSADVRAVGGFNRSLNFAYDYDFWLRLAARGTFVYAEEFFANSRMHLRSKTLGGRRKVFLENMKVLKMHCGYVPFRWVYSYCCHMVDGRDQFFQPLRPSLGKYLLSLFLGAAKNPLQLRRYWRDWYTVMSVSGLVRLWNASRLARSLHLQIRD